MSEELQSVGTAIPNEGAPTTQQAVVEDTQPDSYEERAREQGWRPKEEWDGEEDKWRPAKEFVERGELLGKIDTLGKDLKETRKALRMLQEHHTKVRETEYKRAVDELKALQKQHLEAGNSDGYLETTELLTDLKAEQKAREVVDSSVPKQPDPRFLSWVDQNKWYAQDQQMREYADAIGMGYAQKHPEIDPEDVLKFVASEVKERFKDKFKNPNRNKPSTVEGTGSTAPAKTAKFSLTDEEERVMKTFVRTGAMTKEAFIEEVKRMRGAA